MFVEKNCGRSEILLENEILRKNTKYHVNLIVQEYATNIFQVIMIERNISSIPNYN